MGPSFKPQTAAVWCSCSLWKSSLPFIYESDRKIHLGLRRTVTGGSTAVLKERQLDLLLTEKHWMQRWDENTWRPVWRSQLLLPASLADFQTGGRVLAALSGRLRDPFTACWDISARGGLKAIIVLVSVSLWLIKFSGHMSVYCYCLSLSLLSSSLCLGGAHLWRPPLAHTPGVIRCHGSAWLPEPLFKMAAQHSSLLDRWVTPTSWTCSGPWILWRGVEWNVSVSAWRGVRSEARRAWSVFPGPVSRRFYPGSLLLLSICYYKLWCNCDRADTWGEPRRRLHWVSHKNVKFCHMSPVSIINYIKLEIHYLFNVLN